MNPHNDPDPNEAQKRAVPFGYRRFARWRLGVVAGFISLIALGYYAVPSTISGREIGEDTVVVGFLFLAPFSLSALASVLADWYAEKSAKFHIVMVPSALVGLVMIAGLVLREGIICILMLLPIWGGMAAAGGATVYYLSRQIKVRQFSASIVSVLTLVALILPPDSFSTTGRYEVTSSRVVNAPAEALWPYLLKLDDIRADEGEWTFSQNLLGIPRPVSAEVVQSGATVTRFALWQDGVRFEEVITRQVEGQSLDWTFRFPDPSLANHVDRHINPTGPHLTIDSGGYDLRPISDGAVELTLHTAYTLTSPVNSYASLWAELMLNDIQSNVLRIIKDRAEKAAGQAQSIASLR